MAADEATGSPPTAILVSGMHRSGTSVMTRLVSLLGADLPGSLIEGRPRDNARGFWEGRSIVDLDEDVLARAGSWWGGWQLVAPAALERPRIVERARNLVRDEFEGSDVVVIKDPRMSRLLPLWEQTLTEAGFRCVHLVAVRSPEAVAASLDRRNRLSARAVALSWLAHSLDAEYYTRGEPRVFVSFERLLADWRHEVDRIRGALEVTWERTSEEIASEVEEFIDPGLVNGPDPAASAGALRAVGPVSEVLHRWAQDDVRTGDADLLDQWRRAVAPVRSPRSAVAEVARTQARTARSRRSAGATKPRAEWKAARALNRGYNVEADAAWAWLQRERRHASSGPPMSGVTRAPLSRLARRVARERPA